MKVVIQRVSSASVSVAGRGVSRIGKGLLLLVGIEKGDGRKEIDYMAQKIAGLRIFNDDAGKMNRSLIDENVKGEILAVSQFTLIGDIRKGRRPSFVGAEEPDKAEPLFSEFVDALGRQSVPVKTGVFGAMMEVTLVNDGPVTFVLDTREVLKRAGS